MSGNASAAGPMTNASPAADATQRLSIVELKRMLTSKVERVVSYLLPNGKRNKHEWEAGSTRGEEGKSLKVHLDGEKAGLWSDFATGEAGDLIDLWKLVHGLDLVPALDEISLWLGVERSSLHRPETSRRREVRPIGPRPPQIAAASERTETIDQLRERIAALLRRAVPIKGMLAERYLTGRDLAPDIADPDVLRFLPPNGSYPPAMLSLITDFRDDAAILGLQITSLAADGRKIERKFLRGTKPKGGVVRLIEDAEVTTELGLAEGVETALAVMTAMRQAGRTVRPVWSALNAGNLADLPVLPGVERLYIYADRDANGTGQRAAEALARRWFDAGRESFIALPKSNDWNDAA